MQDHKKRIYSVIEEILSHLYMFALRITSSQKKAKSLLQMILVRVDYHLHDIPESNDLKAWLFRLLYQFYLENEDPSNNKYDEESYQKLEEFYLYNCLEEDHILDQDEKLKLISNIDQNDLEEIIKNLPIRLRPYMLLKDIIGFNYHEISFILDVPLDVVASELILVNNRFQSEIWKKLVKKHQSISSKP